MDYNNCKKDIDMAMIPYIEHEHRLYRAYIREQRFKYGLIISNAVWIVLFVLKAGGII